MASIRTIAQDMLDVARVLCKITNAAESCGADRNR